MPLLPDPMLATLPREVPLSKAPIESVIAQVRFPTIASIDNIGFVAPFQEAIRSTYPTMREETVTQMAVGPGGFTSIGNQPIWRFMDATQEWRVSLTRDFLAIETKSYKSRTDLVERLRKLVDALHETAKPAHVDRLGVRYVNRVRPPELDSLSALVRDEVRGIVVPGANGHLSRCLTESCFAVESAELITRWGYLPAKTAVTQLGLEAIDEPSWLLDLDMYSTIPIAFESNAVAREAERFAQRIYTFFRWTVTDEFLGRYGGKP